MTRKLLISLLLICLGCTYSFAGPNPLRLQSGSLAPLKNCGGTIYCTLDFSKAKANRKPLAEYLEDDYDTTIDAFNREIPDFQKWFEDRWNDDIEEGPKITSNEKNANFRVNIIVKTLQMGAKNYMNPAGASVSGYAQFYRAGESEPFAVVELLKVSGTIAGGYVAGYLGIKQSFNDIAEYLCDLIYKSK